MNQPGDQFQVGNFFKLTETLISQTTEFLRQLFIKYLNNNNLYLMY